MTFNSIALLVLYQVISSIRASSLFQKYGLVRMLFWVLDDDRNGLLPRSCQRRRRMAMEGELSTDWIMEIAGPDVYPSKGAYLRDREIDLDSARRVIERMQGAGIKIPEGRESNLIREASNAGEAGCGLQQPSFARSYLRELRELEAAFATGGFDMKTTNYKRLVQLRYRLTRAARETGTALGFIREQDTIAGAYESRTDPVEVHQRELKWNAEVNGLTKARRAEFGLIRDNLHLFHQDPPVMHWDRRELEPLTVDPTEFFPNAPCSLLDIQPKAMHPLMRAMGRNSNRAGDMFEFILRGMMQSSADRISKAIENVWPGAADGVLPHCPSLRDRAKGGNPVAGNGEISPRTLNSLQLTEILEAWMKWPFRPTYPQLVSRMLDDGAASELVDEVDNDVLA